MNVSAESGAPRRAGQRHEVGLAQLPPAPPTTVAVIEGLATGTPRRVVNQSDAADRVAELFLDPGQRERIPRVYQKSRITTRRMAVDPLDAKFDVFRREPATIRDRMHLFYEHAVPLAVDVSKRALAGLPYRAAEIGLLVLATSTGFIAPGVDVAIVKELGLSPSISRVVVNFMGCAAAMNALGTATNYVRAHPAMKALVVCIELCSVNAVFADDINDVVIHSLFGDGCAALVIGASQVQEKLEPGKVVVRSSFSQLLDNTEDGIVLGVNHNGITCELSENLPGYIFSGVAPVVTEMLWDNGLQISDIDLSLGDPSGWPQDHRAVGALAGDLRGAGGAELGRARPLRQHAQRIAYLCARDDGAAGGVGQSHLDGGGVRVRAGRHCRRHAVRHHPTVTAMNSEHPMTDRVVYRSLMADNLRWDALQLRDGDIIISAPSKSGLTWTQRLVSLLVFDGPDLPGPLSTVSPWLDQTIRPIEEVVATLDAQQHRRFIKTHTPLDGLVLDDRVSYICVGRDPRDAAVSMLYQSANMNEDRMRILHEAVVPFHERIAPPFAELGHARSPTEEFRDWMEGPNQPPPGIGFTHLKGIGTLANILHQLGTVWVRRHLPNVALFHYADYQADLAGELLRLARVLGIAATRDRARDLAQYATLDAMRSRASEIAPNTTDGIWHSDERFFRRGGSGDWQQFFTEAEHLRYYHRINQLAPPDLLAWAHEGRRGYDPAN